MTEGDEGGGGVERHGGARAEVGGCSERRGKGEVGEAGRGVETELKGSEWERYAEKDSLSGHDWGMLAVSVCLEVVKRVGRLDMRRC